MPFSSGGGLAPGTCSLCSSDWRAGEGGWCATEQQTRGWTKSVALGRGGSRRTEGLKDRQIEYRLSLLVWGRGGGGRETDIQKDCQTKSNSFLYKTR